MLVVLHLQTHYISRKLCNCIPTNVANTVAFTLCILHLQYLNHASHVSNCKSKSTKYLQMTIPTLVQCPVVPWCPAVTCATSGPVSCGGCCHAMCCRSPCQHDNCSHATTRCCFSHATTRHCVRPLSMPRSMSFGTLSHGVRPVRLRRVWISEGLTQANSEF